MTQSTKSLLQDLATYKRGTSLYRKANNKLRAIDKRRRQAKERKRHYVYKPRDRVAYKRFYGMNKDNILDLLGCTNVQVWQYHKHGTLGRMLKMKLLGSKK